MRQGEIERSQSGRCVVIKECGGEKRETIDRVKRWKIGRRPRRLQRGRDARCEEKGMASRGCRLCEIRRKYSREGAEERRKEQWSKRELRMRNGKNKARRGKVRGKGKKTKRKKCIKQMEYWIKYD